MRTNHTALFEIGIEELPARFIEDAETQLREKTSTWLDKERITFAEITTYSTPRRLAIVIKGIANRQETIVEKIRGPKVDIAKNEAGEWTKAAIGFSKGQGKTVDDIFIEEIKGISYTFVEKRIEGKETFELLKEFPTIISSLTFPQTMRWGNQTYRFSRPIRWLVGMMNNKVIPFEVANVKSNNVTYGHRFLGKKIFIELPEDYEKLLDKSYVIANYEKRKQSIVEQIKQLEKKQLFHIDIGDELLQEVTNLVEYPTVFFGQFDEQFLSLPEEVLITSMREHQRYFPVFKDEAKAILMPYFVGVRNGDDTSLAQVAQGNEKVLRARLADAQFFYDEDRKQSIEHYVDKLKTVIFQEELGTLHEKLIRVTKLSEEIAGLLTLSTREKDALTRAASICKFDLVTNMVNEFPELQGIIGEKYAEHFNEEKIVAEAIKDHYKPQFAKDSLPESTVASILSVADKLDTIVGTISIGLVPSGSQDPYGLRRQANGVLNILLEKRWHIPFEELLSLALKPFASKEHKEALVAFLKDRIYHLFYDKGIERDVILAVTEKEIGVVHYAFAKAQLLSNKRNDESFKLAQESFVRVLNLAKKDEGKTIDEKLFQTESEKTLYARLSETKDSFAEAELSLDAKEALNSLEQLAEPIEQFFEHNMVMDSNEAIRHNRLALIQQLAEMILKFGNLTVIEWKQHH